MAKSSCLFWKINFHTVVFIFLLFYIQKVIIFTERLFFIRKKYMLVSVAFCKYIFLFLKLVFIFKKRYKICSVYLREIVRSAD